MVCFCSLESCQTLHLNPIHRYDSVIFTGQLAWQDRLNSLNLPFFLSSTSIFTNYTVCPHSLHLENTLTTHFTVGVQLPEPYSRILPFPRRRTNRTHASRPSRHRKEVAQRHLHGRGRLGAGLPRRRRARVLPGARPHLPRLARAQRRALRAGLDMGERAGQARLGLAGVVVTRAYAVGRARLRHRERARRTQAEG